MKNEMENLKETDAYFLKLIQDVVESLNKIDVLIETNSKRQSDTDSKISDYEHIIENEELTDQQAVSIVKKLKEERVYRRHQKNEFELINAYRTHKEKLSSPANRQFFTTEIYKVWMRLNQKYNMRILTEEEVVMFTSKSKKEMTASTSTRTKKEVLKTKNLMIKFGSFIKQT